MNFLRILRRMVSRQWILTTLLVILGSGMCVRLGVWQLDRLEQRRAFNAQVEQMQVMDRLDLNRGIPVDIESMEWRKIVVTGTYDHEYQVALRNQYHGDQLGYHLITPLVFNRGVVLVDRGWIPVEGNPAPRDWRKYDQAGQVVVYGQIRLGQGKSAFGGLSDPLPQGGDRLEIWNNLDVARIASQLPLPALDIFIQPEVDPSDAVAPIPFQPVIELTEGPHFGYALQWFTFATLLLVGYPFYLRNQEKK